MHNLTLLPAYFEVEENLQLLQIPLTAAECHGLICGSFCSSGDIETARQLLLAQGVELTEDSAIDMLNQLCEVTSQQFADQQLSFQLLLPDDAVNLSLRSAAIGLWCQGFISGLGENNLNLASDLQAEFQELLHDLAEIAQIESDNVIEDETNEMECIELVEYVRIAALTIHTDLLLNNKNVITSNFSNRLH